MQIGCIESVYFCGLTNLKTKIMENLNNPNWKDEYKEGDVTASLLTYPQIYAKQLNRLPNLLEQFLFEIYDVLSNLAMAGELSEVDSGFDINEELMFMIDDFRNLNDQNVQSLYHIYDFIHDKRASIININALKNEG